MNNNSENKKLAESLRHNLPNRAGTIFSEPWEAQAFAIAVTLSDNGYFTWTEWANALAETISWSKTNDGPIDGSDYYLNWVVTLEKILESKSLVDVVSLTTVKSEWERAYKLTPHGEPVSLNE